MFDGYLLQCYKYIFGTDKILMHNDSLHLSYKFFDLLNIFLRLLKIIAMVST